MLDDVSESAENAGGVFSDMNINEKVSAVSVHILKGVSHGEEQDQSRKREEV